MRFFRTRRRLVSVLAVIAALVIAATAAAWYLATGSGNDDVTLGTSPVAISVTVTAPGAPLYPGDDEPVGILLDNDAGNGSVRVNSLGVSFTGLPANCEEEWFTLTVPGFTGVVIPEGDDYAVTGASLSFEDSLTEDQTPCSGATPTITVTAS